MLRVALALLIEIITRVSIGKTLTEFGGMKIIPSIPSIGKKSVTLG